MASFVQQAQAQQGCALVDIFMWCSIMITRAKNCVASLAMFTLDGRCYEHIENYEDICIHCTNLMSS